MDEELELETSPLSQDLSDGGKTVEVQIYREIRDTLRLG